VPATGKIQISHGFNIVSLLLAAETSSESRPLPTPSFLKILLP